MEASGHLFCSCVMFMSQMNAPFVHLKLAEEEWWYGSLLESQFVPLILLVITLMARHGPHPKGEVPY